VPAGSAFLADGLSVESANVLTGAGGIEIQVIKP
jgi:hypothetical protein